MKTVTVAVGFGDTIENSNSAATQAQAPLLASCDPFMPLFLGIGLSEQLRSGLRQHGRGSGVKEGQTEGVSVFPGLTFTSYISPCLFYFL